ncbi:MAG: YggT family protein [Treponema sp.]
MNSVVSTIFRVLSALVSIYTLLCFIRIILTWIPGLSYTKFGQFLAKVCDPYLNLFRKIRWLIIGSFDFSPAVGLCILGAVSTLFANFSHTGKFSLGSVLSMVLSLVWSIFSSLIVFFIILLLIRWIMILVSKKNYSGPIFDQIDRSISPFVYKIASTFNKSQNMSYKTALILSAVILVLILIASSLIINFLASLLASLPF